MQTAFENLYGLGAETVDSARPGQATPAQALAGVAAASKLAKAIHSDVERSSVRPMFKRAWRTFFNKWLTFETLHASYETQSDPTRVLDVDVPRWVEQLHEWRDVLAREPGGNLTATRIGADAKPGFPWKPVLLAVGAGAAALGARWWWVERQKAEQEEQERLAAYRAYAANGTTGAMPAYAATLPMVAVPPPPAWPAPPPWAVAPTMPAMPAAAMPPGYAVVRVA